MTLRKKLVALIVATVLLVCAILAIVLTSSLHGNLYGQLDDSLRSASNRSTSRPDLATGPDRTLPSFPDGSSSTDDPSERITAGQAAGTITISYYGNLVIDAGFIDESGDYQYLTKEQFQVLDAIDQTGEIVSVKVPEIGNFRAISGHTRSGNRVITAMSTANAQDAIRAFMGLEALLIVLAVSGAGVIGLYVIRRTLKPLDAVAQTARRVSELPLSQGEVSTLERVPEDLTDEATEVGQVGAALNRMLGHVQDALAARHDSETQVRQFVADASHELRTPLASIRGYAELVRMTRTELPESTSQALSRIESESVRMSGLVEDMLLLAHLDAGRELATDPVDLSMLCVLTLSDAHAAGRDHVWKLDIPEEPCEVLGDEPRLQQVLVNLLANARVHTPAGTEVTLALKQHDNGSTEISVANDGPMIPLELQASMFQRFSRGDTSRNRTGGSTGLGLAIAHAIVTAHGGTLSATSTPQATTFTVLLPAEPPKPSETAEAVTQDQDAQRSVVSAAVPLPPEEAPALHEKEPRAVPSVPLPPVPSPD